MNTIITITNFITSLGSTVMLPIIILILGLMLKMKLSKAIVSALTIGVGFVGLGLIIDLLSGALDPVAKALVERFGLNLTALDVGWPAASAIAFGTTIGALIIPIIFLFNIILLSLKLTKTLDVDIWNYWHFAFSGSIAYLWSGNNLIIGIVVALIHCFISFKIADITASKVQTFFNIPGISIPQAEATATVPIVFILDKIIDRIPVIKDINFNIENIQNKIGILGLPLVMGTIIGLILGLLSYGLKKESLNLAIQMGAIMVLCPRIISLFMEGFAPVSEAAREFMQKRFKNQEFNIGLDSAIMIGHPTTILVSSILIPITLILAFILPGNKVLPFADLASITFSIAFVTPLVKGNFFRTLIYGIVIMALLLYISTGFASGLTDIAKNIGYELPEDSSIIAVFSEGNWIAYILTNIARLITGN